MYRTFKIPAMESKITSNIRVTVVPSYDIKNSYPSDNRYVFRYNIFLENLGGAPVQLIKRSWLVYDIGYGFSHVEGDGVIGLTPEIFPTKDFGYFSNVVLRSGIGHMSGSYTFKNLLSGELFQVEVPRFDLVTAVLAN